MQLVSLVKVHMKNINHYNSKIKYKSLAQVRLQIISKKLMLNNNLQVI